MDICIDEILPEGKILEFTQFNNGNSSFGIFRVIVPFSLSQVLDKDNKSLLASKGYMSFRPEEYVRKLLSEGYIEKVDKAHIFMNYASRRYSTLSVRNQ